MLEINLVTVHSPQPFRMTSFEAKLTESAVFSDRIYVDYDSFLISYETVMNLFC